MGDWSNNLEYEQREYYGHLYDTDEGVHEEEETDDLISKQKVLNTLDFADNALTDEERTVENFKAILTECIKVLSSDSEYPNKCFDGMTNGEVRPKGEWVYKPVKKYCSPDCWHPPCADCLTWNKEEGSWLEDEMFCSKCDWQNCDEIKSNFCPYCGADMRGEQK